jgi:DNA-binding NarL/FixJ family response regulator
MNAMQPTATMSTQSSPSVNRPRRIAAAAERRIRVLVVDDHPAVRLGVQSLIDDQHDMCVVAEARSADAALSKLEHPIDVAIVDFHLGFGQDGLWLTARLKRLAHAPRVLIYSAFADAALAVTAIIAGADGLLAKDELGDELCRAIRRLARGQHRLPAITESVARVMRSQLEPRDQAIFGMLMHGVPPAVTAEELGISEDELHTRRLIMLRTLKRSADPMVGARSPLDYQRPKRRRSRWAA